MRAAGLLGTAGADVTSHVSRRAVDAAFLEGLLKRFAAPRPDLQAP
jgi:hypothetical protein